MNQPEQDHDELLAMIADEWLALGTSTRELIQPERDRCEWAVRSAIEEVGPNTYSMLFFWVPSPMAGVMVSTQVGFALEKPMTDRISKALNMFLAKGSTDAQAARRAVDDVVWRAREAVHAQIAAELEARGAQWEDRRRELANWAWNHVWEVIGDPIYGHGWAQRAAESDGLFEENLASWATAMVDGQFGAGAMAQLDAMQVIDGVDIAKYDGVRRLAALCGWWWPFQVGAVLCEPPVRFEVSDDAVSIEWRDGWTVQA